MVLDFLATIETEDEYNAIDQIYRLYYGRMVMIALDILHNKSDAEDAVMDAIKYMCDQPSMFLDYETSQTYSLVCMKVKCSAIDIFRRKKREASRFISLNDEIESTTYDESDYDLSNILINAENQRILYQALNELDHTYQIPIILKYFYQMRSREIADFMGLTVEAVDMRIHRAKRILKKMCIDRGCQ